MHIHRRPWRALRATAATAALVAIFVPASGFTTSATSRLVPGVSFRISSTTKIYPGETPRAQDDEVMRGRGVALDNKSRVEFLAFTPPPSGVTTDDFIITLDSGHVFVLHNNTQRFTSADDVFGGPAVVTLSRVMGGGRGFPGGGGGGGGPPGGGVRGGRGGGGPPGGARGARGGRGPRRGRGSNGMLDQVDLLDVSFKLEKIGEEQIDGRAAQHVRITTDYRVLWGDKAFPAHAVTEMWTAKLPVAIPNPFEPLIVAEQSGDGPLIEYALKLRAVRAQLEGTPIKVITTTTFTEFEDVVGLGAYVSNDPNVKPKLTVVQQTAITNVQASDVDPKLFTVQAPEG